MPDRPTYLDALAACDLFVFPSGFPKVILDAMAVGLPVVATPSGSLAGLGRHRLELVAPRDFAALADAISALATDPTLAHDLRVAGSDFAAAHTRIAEASRLVARWQNRYPGLAWG